jgi:hypothetical protein
VLQVLKSKAQVLNERLQLSMTVYFSDGTPPERMLMHTSFKKHLKSSYQTNDGYTPKAAPRNTMCNVSLEIFKEAFERYADHLMQAMRAHGTAIAPNTIVYSDRSGVYFTSDVAIAGMDIHCFPCLPAHQISNVVFDLDSQQFGDMVKMLRFLYDAGVDAVLSKRGDANNGYQRQNRTPWFRSFFTEMERAVLLKKINVQHLYASEIAKSKGALKAPRIKSGVTADSMVENDGLPWKLKRK